MDQRQGRQNSKPGATGIRAAQTEIEALLCKLVSDAELKVFAYRWGSEVLDSGREQCKLTFYFEDQAKSLSFDCRDLQDREPGFWKNTVPHLIRREVQAALA
jgi:hypothetical protein